MNAWATTHFLPADGRLPESRHRYKRDSFRYLTEKLGDAPDQSSALFLLFLLGE